MFEQFVVVFTEVINIKERACLGKFKSSVLDMLSLRHQVESSNTVVAQKRNQTRGVNEEDAGGI